MAAFGQIVNFPRAAGDTSGLTADINTVSGRVLGGDLPQASGVLKRTHTELTPGVDSSKMRALAGGERAAITNRNNQVGTGPASILAGHVVPRAQAGPYRPAPPTSLASHTEQVDGPIPMLRTISSPNAYELPGDRQLVFIKKPVQASQRMLAGLVRQRPLTVAAPQARGAPGLPMHSAAYEHTDGNTLVGKHLQSLNCFLLKCQLELFKKDPARYATLTASEVWHGCELPWTGWTLDGVCRLEEITNGKSSKESDGYGATRGLGRYSKGVGPNAVQKTMSVVRAGRVSMLDYFQSRGITRGALLYLVLTKTKWPSTGYGNDSNNITFVSSTKSGTLDARPQNVSETVSAGSFVEQKALPSPYFGDKLKRPFMGFMLHCVAVPDGGSPDSSFYHFIDEWGHHRHNALVMRFGRVLFEPFRFTPQGTILTADHTASGFAPAIDGTDAMVRMPFPDVLLDPCKDGVFGMF